MKLTFAYERSRDIWCILNYGKTSMNSPTPTKVYKNLIQQYGNNPSESDISNFVVSYMPLNQINTDEMITVLQRQWDTISSEYQNRAEEIFGITLPDDVTAYITINDRRPYSIQDNMFYVTTAYPNATNKAAMHELWHFYT